MDEYLSKLNDGTVGFLFQDVDGFILRILVDLSYGYPLELENEKMMLSLLETASMLQVLLHHFKRIGKCLIVMLYF